MNVKIFVMAHKKFEEPADSMYVPLQVGHAAADDLGYLADDTGNHISQKNPNYCELTGMYWLWKNYHETEYIGICHYRRYLINGHGAVFTEQELLPLLSEYDVISTRMLTLTCSYYYGFSENHHLKDLILTGEVIREKYPDYYPLFDSMVHDVHTYFGNILITSKKIYDAYCSWLFDILFEVEKRVDMTSYNNYNKRLFGFLSEFLQTVWIAKQGLSVCECKVGMLGEKYETRIMRKNLASFFAKRNFADAGTYFMECYGKRPDVLMEASDITGELHLCMQVISTCAYESDVYGCCLLDKLNDYTSLMHHCHVLNDIVNRFLTAHETESDMERLKNSTAISPIAVEISVQMFCKDTQTVRAVTPRICQYLPKVFS